jgi:hypothetical protein
MVSVTPTILGVWRQQAELFGSVKLGADQMRALFQLAERGLAARDRPSEPRSGLLMALELVAKLEPV